MFTVENSHVALGRWRRRTVFRPDILVTRPGVEQRPVDGETFVRQHAAPFGHLQDFLNEGLGDLPVNQPMPIAC